MKNKTFLVLTATAAYSYLFYKQSPGMNHTAFSFALVILFALSDIKLLKNKTWLAAALCMLVCGTLTGINGTHLNFVMNFISTMVISYVTANPDLSVITGITYSGLTTLSGLFINFVIKLSEITGLTPSDKQKSEKKLKWYYFIIPLFLLTLFLVLYRESSEGFRELTNMIDLSFISIPWFFFTFAGFIFLYGLFIKPKEFDFFNRETNLSNQIERSPSWKTSGFLTMGVISFLMLDFLLIIVNTSDIIYLSFLDKANKGMTYSELIHQGIGSLIISLILAIAFILLWFNQQNTDPKLKRIIKFAAFAWIVLNLIMLATNIWKNNLYISAHGLTYKRIGVYFSLFLAFLTLAFCANKIINEKNNLFMYRRFGLVLLLLTFLFNCFNWDRICTEYNIKLYKTSSVPVDTYSLLQLSPDCLPELIENWEILNPTNSDDLNKMLDNNCMEFISRFEKQNWRGLTLNNYLTYNKLKNYKPLSKNRYNDYAVSNRSAITNEY